MRKINSIYYGGKIIAIGIILSAIIPGIFYIVNKFLKLKFIEVAGYISVVIGFIILIGFFILLLIELHQDKQIDKYYKARQNTKLPLKNGFFECSACGNRYVKEKDEFCNVCGIKFIKLGR